MKPRNYWKVINLLTAALILNVAVQAYPAPELRTGLNSDHILYVK